MPSRCITGLGECGSHIVRLASILLYLEVSTFRFVLVSFKKRLIRTRKHARIVDSETCASCFHNQKLITMTNSHASLSKSSNRTICFSTENTASFGTRGSFLTELLRNKLSCRQIAACNRQTGETRCKTISA